MTRAGWIREWRTARARVPVQIGGLAAIVCAVVAAGSWAFATLPTVRPRQAWTTGYWIWAGRSPTAARFRPELLYAQVVGRRWPRHLPQADQVVIVRRLEPFDGLTPQKASAVIDDYKALVEDAGTSVHIAGLQIDYDSSTEKLESYGRFLKSVRRGLPAESRLSITALLDWFRPRTAVAGVLESVDEFVPQFYDTGLIRAAAGIAEPIDPEKWASVFNAYGIPYRIGVSTFGRIARRHTDPSGRTDVRYFRDASPIDFAGRPQLTASARENRAGELLVNYEVVATLPSRPELQVGDGVDVTFPTERSVRTAYQAVRRFGGYCAGPVFFRWPNQGEALALPPDDVRQIVAGQSFSSRLLLSARNETCLERRCIDLSIDVGSADVARARTFGVRASVPIDVFFRDGPVPASQVRPDLILVSIPPYAGLGTTLLGRAISQAPARFEVIDR